MSPIITLSKKAEVLVVMTPCRGVNATIFESTSYRSTHATRLEHIISYNRLYAPPSSLYSFFWKTHLHLCDVVIISPRYHLRLKSIPKNSYRYLNRILSKAIISLLRFKYRYHFCPITAFDHSFSLSPSTQN